MVDEGWSKFNQGRNITKKAEVISTEGTDCIDKMPTRIRKTFLEGDLVYVVENKGKKLTVEYHVRMVAHKGVAFDYWIFLQNLNAKYYVISDGSIDRT